MAENAKKMVTEADLYVAVEGNDAWFGTLPAPNDDGTDGPLATLAGARECMQTLKKDRRNYLVLIRCGIYTLDETVVFGLDDAAPSERITSS